MSSRDFDDSRGYSWMRPSEPAPGFQPIGDVNMITKIKEKLKDEAWLKKNLEYDLSNGKLYNHNTNSALTSSDLKSNGKSTYAFVKEHMEVPEDKLTPENIAYVIQNYKFKPTGNTFKTFKEYFSTFSSVKPLEYNKDEPILYNAEALNIYLLDNLVKALVIQNCCGIPPPTSGGRRRKRRTNKRKRLNKRRRSNKRYK